METTPKPTVHHFREINPGKYASVKHYELDQVENGTSLLADQINISKDRKFARSNPDYWLKIKQGKKWSKPITGLFKTSTENLYKGDCNYKQHLLILRFTEDQSRATVYYFKDFFTADLQHVLSLTQWKLQKPKRGAHNPSLSVQMFGNTATHTQHPKYRKLID